MVQQGVYCFKRVARVEIKPDMLSPRGANMAVITLACGHRVQRIACRPVPERCHCPYCWREERVSEDADERRDNATCATCTWYDDQCERCQWTQEEASADDLSCEFYQCKAKL